ncbi:carbohydrate ABC transporter permease [Brachybacterium kimchii]|uniref:Carbohydrate ABC transporter permease n=1 Tax=Brachybacterium kimchii TaxID=2942909 RepID=A0ABY4N2X6_9MICO|nr:carbohydrate ABC transporter permease [Brachybacterium kimchii]UQN28923.1 carbohydrate ABC transporter permease [Brachybacterium kimchii]
MTDRLRRAALIVLGIIWLVPVYLIVVNAAKTPEVYGATSAWMPSGFAPLLANLSDAWTQGRIADGVLSTTLYSIVSPLIAVVIGASAGFAIVVLRLRHGFAWFVVIFSASVLPMQILLVPLFQGFVAVDLYDTHLGMILVYTVISVPFSAFVMRNFFSGIAAHVFEAAVMDGATTWRIFWRIHLPMSRSALVAVFILQATMVWNDLILGLTLTHSESTRPVMPALSALQSTYGGAAMPTVLAGGLLVSVPTVVLFLITQRAFSKGLALGQF